MSPTMICLFMLIANLTIGKSHEFSGNEIYTDFMLDYFTTRRIQNIVMFLCWDKGDRMQTMEHFSKHNIRTAVPSTRNSLSHRYVEKILNLHQLTSVGVVLDLCCFDQRSAYTKKHTYFNSSYTWLIFNCDSIEYSMNMLKNLSLGISTDIVLANYNNDSADIKLHDIYHTGINKGGRFNSVYIGKWIPNNSSNEINSWSNFFSKSQVYRRPNLSGVTMRTVTLTENNHNGIDTHTYLLDEEFPNIDTLFKMNYQIITILQEVYNFTIKFVMADNWSDRNSKGVYKSGNLLGLFADGKGDIMAGALLLREDRVEITDVLYMTYPLRCGFIFRYLGDFGDSQTSFYSPFHKRVWYCFLTIIAIVIFIMWNLLMFENKYVDSLNKTLWNFSDTALSILGACCQMGTEIAPITSASRIVYFIFFFSCLVIYNFYTSSIVSSLLNIKVQKFTVIDLANSPLKCGSFDVGYVHNLLFDIPLYPNMDYFNKKKKTNNFYFPIEEGVQKVKKGGFAYHAEFNSFYKTIENMLDPTEICELQEADTIPRNMMGILGLKYSPYSEMWKVALNRIAQSGHLDRQHKKWLSKKPECQSNMIFKEVGFHQIMSSHILLCIGFVFAFTIMFVERKKHFLSSKLFK